MKLSTFAFRCASVTLVLGSLTAMGIAPQPAQETQPPTEAPRATTPPAPSRGDVPTSPPTPTLQESWLKALEWRSIGPANMGGRITDLTVNPADPTNYWVATASGGLLKTVNNGASFVHQFDGEATVSLGAVAVSASNPEIVWVGTGESNPRNSVSWGDGVYKSTDGGKTWTNMGLRQSFQIGRVIIHPTNPEVVYVGAMGRCWGTNEERGLFKTEDGGATWNKILYVDEKTGVVDAVMHPQDPDTLLVAMWERQRDIYCSNDPEKKWGPGSGLYKTTDGGKSFRKITEGLPTSNLGRLGLNYFRKNPDVVVMTVDCERIGKASERIGFLGVTGEDAEAGAKLTRITEKGPAETAGLKVGDIVLGVNDTQVLSYQELLKTLRDFEPEQKVTLKVSRNREPLDVEVTMGKRPGGPDDRPYTAYLGGQQANIQDQQGPDGHEFGGVYRSDDGGETWKRINSLNPRPMYFSKIRIDPTDENIIFVLGVSLHWSKDGGKTFRDDAGRGVHADHHAMWINPANPRHIVLGCDGGVYLTYDQCATWDHLNHMAIGQFYHVAVDPRAEYRVYGGLQDNGSWGGPTRSRSGSGPTNNDWFRVGGGDGFICQIDPNDPDQIYYESQNGGKGWRNLATGRGGPIRPVAVEGERYRFNWRTPFILSHHNSRIYYSAGNHVFRSLNGGANLRRISPEITRTDRGSATALAESMRDSDVLYVGTDDGALWGSRDGGVTWVDLFNPPKEEAKRASSTAAAAEPPAAGGAEQPRTPAEAPAAAPAGQTELASAEQQNRELAARTEQLREENQALAERNEELAERQREGGRSMRGRFETMLEQMDQNQDGKLSRSELPERMQGMFERLDANGDGLLDREELQAMAARFGEGRGGRGRGAPAEAGAAPAAPPVEATQPAGETAQPPKETEATSGDISGRWTCRVQSDVPNPDFGLTLRLGEDGKLTGEVRSTLYTGPISEGSYDPSSRKLTVNITAQQVSVTLNGTLEGETLKGTMSMAEAALSLPFEATREGPAEPTRAAGPPPSRRSRRAAQSGPPPALPGKALSELVPGPRAVASIEPSRAETGRVYIVLDGHRFDDDAPYALVSEDHGRTWRMLTSDLPTGSARVLREDIVNPDILYLGTEFACYVSIDRGATWTKFNNNLPTVAVHEIAQHPTNGEIVAATHGRSLWVLDVTPLRQLTQEARTAVAHLYTPNKTAIWRSEPSRGWAKSFVGQNPSSNKHIYYSLTTAATEVSLKILNPDGTTVRELKAPSVEPGLHRVAWDLRRDAPVGAGDSRPGGPAGPPRFGRGMAPRVTPGSYKVVLSVDGKELMREVVVAVDPTFPDYIAEEEEATETHHLHEKGEPAPVFH